MYPLTGPWYYAGCKPPQTVPTAASSAFYCQRYSRKARFRRPTVSGSKLFMSAHRSTVPCVFFNFFNHNKAYKVRILPNLKGPFHRHPASRYNFF